MSDQPEPQAQTPTAGHDGEPAEAAAGRQGAPFAPPGALPGGVGPEARFAAFLAEGRFMLQRSRATGRHVFQPRLSVPGSGETDLEWVPASGRGTVHAVTVNRRREGSHNVALIDLAEGVRMMSHVAGVETVAIGMAVEARIETLEGAPAVVFVPVEAPAAEPAAEPRGEPAAGPLAAPAVVPAGGAAGRALRGRTAIAGIGTFNVGEAPGYSATENMAGASLRAIADAGLQVGDIDAVFSATGAHAFPTLTLCEQLGLRPRFVGGANTGGSSFLGHAMEAALALDAGLCDAALIAYGSNQRSAGGRLVSMSEPQWPEVPYRPRHPITGYALAAARHMHRFGTTREMLAEVAVAARAWANLNPEAFARGPLTVDDVLSARMVSDPLTSRDCCLVTDGGGALVMVRAERARDLPRPPVHLLGGGMGQWHRSIAEMPDLTVTAASESGPQALAMAGVGRDEIDLLMLYDAFTINTILFLEDLGFCPKGEGGRFVQGGAIAPGGRLAVNTSGGGLSCMHPGMYGLFLVVEAVQQLRGLAGERQLPSPELALCHGNGGALSSQVTLVLGTAGTV